MNTIYIDDNTFYYIKNEDGEIEILDQDGQLVYSDYVIERVLQEAESNEDSE